MDVDHVPLRRWNVDEFGQMSEIGVLSPGGYELLDGVVYDMNGILRRFSVRDYDHMAEEGLITWEEHAELIQGCVVQPPAFKWKRAYLRTRLGHFLYDAVGDSGVVSQVGHVLLDDETMVQPPVSVLRRAIEDYMDRYPDASDVLLLIEILDPLVVRYAETKRHLYAHHQIPEYWLLDPGGNSVVVHLTPEMGKFTQIAEYRRGQSWASPALGGREVTVEEVLGPAAGAR